MGVKHCIATCNGTVALEIATRAVGMIGEVIVPSFTFIATPHALEWQQITPVFCDIDPKTHNMDPKIVEKMITPRTTGILGVHLWGRPCDVDALQVIANKHGLELMFDASHAFGCTSGGRRIGCFGRAEVFSFHATKFFNTGEGGAVVTNDDDLARQIRLMKNFGFSGQDHVIYIGTNGKMDEMAAVLGLTNLESLEDTIDLNRRNHAKYGERLDLLPGISLMRYDEDETSNYHYIVLEVDETRTGIHRDRLLKILQAENVMARRYFYPGCHRMEPYRSLQPHAHLMLPETEKLVQRVLCLPNGTAIGEAEINGICDLISFAVENASAIHERWHECS